MAKQVATPKQTGNGGCTFEDERLGNLLIEIVVWREDRHLHTALLDLLELDWRTNGAVIKRDTAVRKQFSTILKLMLDRQIPRAMELQDRIARAGS